MDETFQTINFGSTFDATPLVFTLNTTNPSGNPVGSLLRINNVTTTGFDIAHLQANNANLGTATTTPVTVSYLAIEPGTGTIGGLNYSAGTHTTSTKQAGGSVTGTNGYDAVGFGATINNPVVATYVQTFNDTNVATLATAIDSGSITNTGFNLALERGEDNGGTPGTATVAETIGFFAVEAGDGTFMTPDGDTITFDFLNTLDNITGADDAGGGAGTFNATFVDDPLAVGNLITRDGGDGGWALLEAISAAGFTLAVDEDEANDTERGHTTEAASLFAFSQEFSTIQTAVPEPASVALWAILGIVGFGFFAHRRRR